MRDPIPYVSGSMTAALLTAEELEKLKLTNKRTELVRGVLRVREPAGFLHGVVVGRLAKHLMDYNESRNVGVVLAAETGFTLFRDPDTVRAPDIAFVRSARIPVPLPLGFAELAPDLAVEVLSPGDRPGEVLAKVADWLNAGSALVWVIDPVRRQARIYRADGTDSTLEANGVLTGETMLPGLAVPLETILGV